MNSLRAQIERLESDLKAEPMRHYHYSDLPFAVFCYPPEEEWTLRREVGLLATRIELATRRSVHFLSLGQMLWQIIEDCEGLEAVQQLERQQGFLAAQAQVHRYLTESLWEPLSQQLADCLSPYAPDRDLIFILRAGALAPNLYRISRLLDGIKGRSRVPCVLFTPATIDPSGGMRFMGIAANQGRGSYHTKVYP